MTSVDTLLTALHADPGDDMAWLALADALEEQGQPSRAELARLALWLRRRPDDPDRAVWEPRLQHLLLAGVVPCVPGVTNSLGMRLVLVPAGVFLMGSPEGEDHRDSADEMLHEVRITRPFYAAECLVTQAEYREATGVNPSAFQRGGEEGAAVEGLDTSSFPVECVSWVEAVAFCEELSARPAERAEGRRYRLLTEAEWEYLCRAGNRTPFHFGTVGSSTWMNCDGTRGTPEVPGPVLGRPAPVASYPPNAWGLYDLHGNLDEWCHDWYDHDYYERAPRDDPRGPEEGDERVVRGGNFSDSPPLCRAAFRYYRDPEGSDRVVGFRVAMELRGGGTIGTTLELD